MALLDFHRAIALAPDQPMAYRELAGLYLKQGQELARARQLAQRAVTLESSAPNYFVLSWTCVKTGRNREALDAINQALKIDPGNLEYRRLLQLIQSRH